MILAVGAPCRKEELKKKKETMAKFKTPSSQQKVQIKKVLKETAD